jgi:hypothetical protein
MARAVSPEVVDKVRRDRRAQGLPATITPAQVAVICRVLTDVEVAKRLALAAHDDAP